MSAELLGLMQNDGSPIQIHIIFPGGTALRNLFPSEGPCKSFVTNNPQHRQAHMLKNQESCVRRLA